MSGISQPASPAPSLPRRDRIAILAALAGVTLLAWAYLLFMSQGMGGMGAMPMSGAADVVRIRPWTTADFLLMFLMWAVMMVGMMVPTAVPMTMVYAAVAGYVAMWCIFSIGATLTQWLLDQAALLSPMMVTTSPSLGAGLLIAAGIYQLTPIKNSCLDHCRAPAHFFAQHWSRGVSGAFRMGLHHGAFCLGCCWVLMALLFLGGVMNLLWVALITLFILLEKVIPLGAEGGRVAGVAMILAGIVSLAGLGWG